MTTEAIRELESSATAVAALVADAAEPNVSQPIRDLEGACRDAQRAWSGSPVGYHSRIYYRNFEEPPAGARFSMEWGFMSAISNRTSGDWVEWTVDAAKEAIEAMGGDPDLTEAEATTERLRVALDESRGDVESVLSICLAETEDSLLEDFLEEARQLTALTDAEIRRALTPQGQFMSREAVAAEAGIQTPPHALLLAKVRSYEDAVAKCSALGSIARRAAGHIRRTSRGSNVTPAENRKVFIGHGGSDTWRELKDFIQDRLDLSWDEFNRVPIAGVTNTTRLAEMLDDASIALLVVTGEDEQADGSKHPRLNVVHEAGLFQGRLGFARAIVLLEEGCEEFSNISGLGQIRFPTGNIAASFEEVRRVLEREGIIPN